MKRRSPSVALIWMYQGKNAPARLAEIKGFNYPEFEVIDAGKAGEWSRAIRAVSARTELCVFWVDDEKPVGKDFLQMRCRFRRGCSMSRQSMMTRPDFSRFSDFFYPSSR
ncbi:MAG: hypothetical protein DMG11_23455 [Acidobacteria bacterium]|nr:MAG: hypothetical protein DMG11_23455 [Acidobacteriota bacterium]